MVARFEVYLIPLDPARGSEIQKTRPCLVVSPDEMNRYLKTVIIAPMTTAIKSYPSRVLLSFQDKQGQVALDQMRAVDKSRLVKKLGVIDGEAEKGVLDVLQEMFAA